MIVVVAVMATTTTTRVMMMEEVTEGHWCSNDVCGSGGDCRVLVMVVKVVIVGW